MLLNLKHNFTNIYLDEIISEIICDIEENLNYKLKNVS